MLYKVLKIIFRNFLSLPISIIPSLEALHRKALC